MPANAEDQREPKQDLTSVELAQLKGVEAAQIEKELQAQGVELTEELSQAILALKIQELKDELEERSKPKPVLRVEGGVDAEAVAYLIDLEYKVDCVGGLFQTDEDGRLIDVGIAIAEEVGVGLDDVLARLAPLRNVAKAEVFKVGKEPTETQLIDGGLNYLVKWKTLSELTVSFFGVSGNAMVAFTQKNPLQDLRKLDFCCVVSDGDLVLKAISCCHELREIRLNGCDLTDTGLRSLCDLTKLENLSFMNTKITGYGFADAKYASTLRELNLEDCPTDDAGLEQIGRFIKLEELFVDGHGITDKGVAHLSELKELSALSLSGSEVTAAGLKALANLSKLESLSLDKTAINDKAVRVLCRMKQLKTLAIRNTKISLFGALQLRRALPECSIVR